MIFIKLLIKIILKNFIIKEISNYRDNNINKIKHIYNEAIDTDYLFILKIQNCKLLKLKMKILKIILEGNSLYKDGFGWEKYIEDAQFLLNEKNYFLQ